MPRQQKPIDDKQFRALCAIQCTLPEIASVFDCSQDTVMRWCQREYGCSFATIYKEFSMIGKKSLRHAQFQLAQKNSSMAIFLGKQILGQTDQPVTDGDNETMQAIGKLAEMMNIARKKYEKNRSDAVGASLTASEGKGEGDGEATSPLSECPPSPDIDESEDD